VAFREEIAGISFWQMFGCDDGERILKNVKSFGNGIVFPIGVASQACSCMGILADWGSMIRSPICKNTHARTGLRRNTNGKYNIVSKRLHILQDSLAIITSEHLPRRYPCNFLPKRHSYPSGNFCSQLRVCLYLRFSSCVARPENHRQL
jgi:hypothetical protein